MATNAFVDDVDALDALQVGLPEGSYWELVQGLWRSGVTATAADVEAMGDAAADGSWRGCPLADVAFFTEGFARAWFFTARDGALRKKKSKSIGVAEIAQALTRGVSHGHARAGAKDAARVSGHFLIRTLRQV